MSSHSDPRPILYFRSPASGGSDLLPAAGSPSPRFTVVAPVGRETWATVERGKESTLGLFILQLGDRRDGIVHDRALLTHSPGAIAPGGSCPVRSLRIPGALLLEGASQRLGRRVEKLSLHPLVDLTKGTGRAFGRLLTFAASELDRVDGLRHNEHAVKGLTRAIVSSLLEFQPFQARYEEGLSKAERAPSIGPKHVRRADEIMDERIGEDLSVERMATFAGVSARTLFRNYRRYRGRSPVQALRQTRLARVRDALLAADEGENVTRAATRFGFTHLGRFAALYRSAYGELPSETLRRARAGDS